MTVLRGAARGADSAAAFPRDLITNLMSWIAALVGPARKVARRADYTALMQRNVWQVLAALGLIAATMILIDPIAGAAVRGIPFWPVSVFAEITDFGRSGWILVPTGALLLLLAALLSPALDRLCRGVLAALVVRIGFIFVAVGLPSFIGTVVKRLIGRMRPSIEGPFAYQPFSWDPAFASFPSGHAITAFAALVAIGSVAPRVRPALWAYALTIAISRIVVFAHFPSDVVAGAGFGALGALLVRDWFASRRFGFFIDPEGAVHRFPNPSLSRTSRALGAALDERFPAEQRAAALALPGLFYKRMRVAIGNGLDRLPSEWRAAARAFPGRVQARVTRAIKSVRDRKSQVEWNAARLALSGPAGSREDQSIEGAVERRLEFGWQGAAAFSISEAGATRVARIMNAPLAADFAPELRNDEAQPHVSVVVPVRNEAGNVLPLIEEIAASLAARGDFEVVYVDDGSTDGTAAEIDLAMPDRPWLRYVGHAVSCGQSAAIRSGVAAARGTLVVTLDGDGQNDPAFLAKLIDGLERNPRVGLVAGQRVGRKDTGSKKLQSRIANGVRNAVLRDGTRDTGCGLKAFRRNVFLNLPYFDGLHRFLPALVRREGYEIAYVDVVDRPRRAGQSKYGMWDRLWIGILDLAGVWWLIRRRRRVPQVVEVLRNAD